MRKILLSGFFVLAGMFILTGHVSAAILSKTVNRVYEVRDNSVHVTETSTSTIINASYYVPSGSNEVFDIFNPIMNDPKAQERIDQTKPTISVTDDNGNNLSFTTQIDGQDILVFVPRQYGLVYNIPRNIRIEYDSFSLLSKTGALYDFYVPSFAKEYNFTDDTTQRTYNTRVIIPQRLGAINLVVPQKQATSANGNWEFTFTQEELTGRISWIQIGTTQFYQFEIHQPYPATTSIPIFYNTFSVLIPRNVDSGPTTQTVYYTDISPIPDSVTLDANQNLVANFIVPANASGEIVVKGYASLAHNLDVDIKNSGIIGDIPAAIITDNTGAAQFWEVDAPEIQAAANQLKGDDTNVYSLITKTYDFVVNKIDYSTVKEFGINERQGALKTLEGGAAVCMEYSDLFIALMRAEGVPARGAFGYGYDSRVTNGENLAHQWAEVYIPTLQEWVDVDTTWGESGSEVIGGDMNYFYKYVANIDPNTPAPVQAFFFGSLGPVGNESFAITAIAELPGTGGTQTQQALLDTYPQQTGITAQINNVVRSFQLFTQTADNRLISILQSLHIPDNVLPFARIAVYLAAAAVIVLIPLLLALRGRRKRKHPANKLAVNEVYS